MSCDPDLLHRALQFSGERTEDAVLTQALQVFVARRERRRLVDLTGKLKLDPNYDYKAERTRPLL